MDGTSKADLKRARRKLDLLRKTIFKHLRERDDLDLTARVLDALMAAIHETTDAVLRAQR